MLFDWYNIFNKTDFEALDLVSKSYDLYLSGIGLKSILVTKGNYISMLYEGVFLSVELNDRNPFVFEGYACYIDANDDVWLGIQNA